MKTTTFSFLTGLLAVACISDANRCDKGDVHMDELPEGGRNYYCKSDSGIEKETSETDEPTGLGTVCFGEDDCAEFEADFCAGQPGKEGYCSLDDCIKEPDNCPGDYHCCDYADLGMRFCVTQDDLERLADRCVR